MTTSEATDSDVWDRVQVDRTTGDLGDVVVKTATGGARSRLRREAELLLRLQPADVVQAIEVREEDDRTVLVTVVAGRTTLAHPDHLSGDELVRALRRAVAAVAGLHDAGWSHGAVEPAHVVIGPRGRARLCSLGGAAPLDRTTRAGDGHAVLALVDHVAATRPIDPSWQEQRRWRRRRRRLRALADRQRELRDTPDLRELLDDLGRVDAPRPRPGLLVMIATCACLAVTASAAARLDGAEGVAAAATRPTPDTAPTCGISPAPTRDVDGDGCGDRVRVESNLLVVDDTTYRLGADGDRVAVADWDCDGEVTGLLLRPSTGELYDFPVWATASGATDGRLIATVPGAADLSVAPVLVPGTPGPRSCDHVTVALPDGTEVDPVPPTPKDPP